MGETIAAAATAAERRGVELFRVQNETLHLKQNPTRPIEKPLRKSSAIGDEETTTKSTEVRKKERPPAAATSSNVYIFPLTFL